MACGCQVCDSGSKDVIRLGVSANGIAAALTGNTDRRHGSATPKGGGGVVETEQTGKSEKNLSVQLAGRSSAKQMQKEAS